MIADNKKAQTFEDEAYRTLIAAILKDAVYDYKVAKRTIKKNKSARAVEKAKDMIESCEKFFKSPWAEELSGMDGEDLYNIVSRNVEQQLG